MLARRSNMTVRKMEARDATTSEKCDDVKRELKAGLSLAQSSRLNHEMWQENTTSAISFDYSMSL